MTSCAGECRFCGCTEFDACVVDDIIDVRGCSWVDAGRRVCSVCAPAAKAEGQSLRALRRAGYRVTSKWLQAHHLGFVVAWFGTTARSPYGRNPFSMLAQAEAWTTGYRAGAEARRVYRTTFGEIANEPRRSVLTPPGGFHVRNDVPRDRRDRVVDRRRPVRVAATARRGA